MSTAGHILVMDRERRVRDAVTRVLRRHGWSCDALGEVHEAADALRKSGAEVVVVDLGVTAYRRLLARREKSPVALPVLVATGHPSVAVAALHVGAVAFLPKPVRPRALVQSVTVALEKAQALRSLSRAQRMIAVWTDWLRLVDAVLSMPGPVHLPPGVLGGVARREHTPGLPNETGEWSSRARTLSLREREALFAFRTGLRPRQIADALGVTIHTARAHLKAVMKKLNVHSQVELLGRMQDPWLAEQSGGAPPTAKGVGRQQ